MTKIIVGLSAGFFVGLLAVQAVGMLFAAMFPVPDLSVHDLYRDEVLAMTFSSRTGQYTLQCIVICSLAGAWLGWKRCEGSIFDLSNDSRIVEDAQGRVMRNAVYTAGFVGVVALLGYWGGSGLKILPSVAIVTFFTAADFFYLWYARRKARTGATPTSASAGRDTPIRYDV